MLRSVMTKYGALQGVPSGDPRITVFKGVPYAKPPVGELRFRAPQPPEPWEGVRKADTFGPMSIHRQPGLDWSEFYTKELNPTAYEWEMSEDCLYLNIWSPAKSADEKLPVFFYIHGGGFTAGYPYEVEFDGERVARNGVIYVTMAYRLGALGFFAHPDLDEESQGNFGLLDQRMALQWVRENIAAFGGDPDNITIGGQSAGGMAVNAHLLSPMTEGMFQGAILMSSGGLNPPNGARPGWRTLEEAQEDGVQLLKYLRVSSVEEARHLPAEVIALTGLGNWPNKQRMFWRPTIDGVYLKEDSRDAILAGRVHDVPVLIGGTKGENVGKNDPDYATREKFAAAMREDFGDAAEKVLEICKFDSDEACSAFACDEVALSPFYSSAMAYARRLSKLGRNAYAYLFDHDIPGDDQPGSYHGSDMWFIFDSLGHSWRPFEGKHYDLARQVSSYFANFVKTGDPNGLDRNGNELPQWQNFTEDDPFVICFKDAPERFESCDSPLHVFVQKHYLGEE